MKRKKEKLEASVIYASGGKLSLEILSESMPNLNNGDIVELSYSVDANQRTASQNAFFHKMIADMTPYFDNELDFFSAEYIPASMKQSKTWKPEYLKYVVKDMFLSEYVSYELNGETHTGKFVRHTADLEIGQFCEFMERCIEFFTDAGAPIDLFMRKYERDWLGLRGFSEGE